MKTLASILNRIIREKGWEDKLTASRILDHWEEIFGDKAAKVVELKGYEDKVLYLKVSNPAWKMEIMLRKSILKDKINEIVENNIVEEIVIH